MSDSKELYCHRFRVKRSGLAQLARRHHHPANSEDVGYQVHALLAALFGERAPSPFAVDPDGQARGPVATVLAYGITALEDLNKEARATADPQVYDTLVWDQCAAKPMPETWKEGAAYRYRVRVCPVRRRKQEDGQHRELDALLASPEPAPEDDRSVLLRRQFVYEAWLREQIEGALERTRAEQPWQGGASIESCALDSFRLTRLMRHNRERKLAPVPNPKKALRQGASGRPDATLSGILRVKDGQRFGCLLARGVGRHRAFGFGMLLLKRA